MLEPGTLVGRYKIERRLGRGGMGTLYVAMDPVLARSVALKLFLGDIDSSDYRERFAREARAVAALNHPNIVTVHDYGEFSAQPFIVMELIDGHTLADLNESARSIPLDERLRWIEELCAGVAFVHREGIIHRDIKPSNAMVDRSRRLKLLDFGIARMGSAPSASVTGPLGSPGYMAPEQINGGSIDHRADIFAIGAVSYELLAAAPAFGGAPFEQIHKILNVDPTPPSEIVSNLPPELSDAIMQALARDPASRFSDAESLGAVVSSIRRRLDVAEQERDRDLAPTVVRRPPAATPTTPRPGRETWTRRRAERIAATLQEANSYYERGQLDEAREACEQALTIDETQQEALVLYEKVKAALAHREALGYITDAQHEMARGELAAAAAFLQRARTLDPDAPEAARIERDLRLKRVEAERTRKRKEMVSGALTASEKALRRVDPEAALLHAREALDLEPDNATARRLEESALQLLNGNVEPSGAVSTSVMPPGPTGVQPTPTPSRKVEARSTRVSRVSDVVHRIPHLLKSSLAPTKLALRRRFGLMAIAASVLVVVAVTTWMARPVPVAPVGTLVIDAVPWATVTAVVGEDGKAVALPEAPSTPLSLDVPAGTYRVSLQGPPPEGGDRQFEVQVVAGQIVPIPRLEFLPLTPEMYFEAYLVSPNGGSER